MSDGGDGGGGARRVNADGAVALRKARAHLADRVGATTVRLAERVVAEGPWSKPPPTPLAAPGWSAPMSTDPPRGAMAGAEAGAANSTTCLEALHGLGARLSLSARYTSSKSATGAPSVILCDVSTRRLALAAAARKAEMPAVPYLSVDDTVATVE